MSEFIDPFHLEDSEVAPWFDRQIECFVTKHNLPHWDQENKIQFVTFRLADSLPVCKRQDLRERYADFIKRHPKPWDRQTMHAYRLEVGPLAERLLDQGYGSCLLQCSDVRDIVINSLRDNDGVKFLLWLYVLMPNHVHFLATILPGYKLHDITGSIKKYTARRINQLVGRQGQLWSEDFDRLIRSEEHLREKIRYILANPRHLPSDTYTLGGRLLDANPLYHPRYNP